MSCTITIVYQEKTFIRSVVTVKAVHTAHSDKSSAFSQNIRMIVKLKRLRK
jgi:hypothetical protein